MKTPHDPFAAGVYDLAGLPVVSESLADYASTDVDLLHRLLKEEGAYAQPIAVYDHLATQVLASYEPGAWRVLDPKRLFHKGVTTASGGWGELAQATVPVRATDAQKQERRARLSAAIRLKAQNSNEYPRTNVRRALVHALDLGTKLRKRKEAANIAVVEGRYLAQGMLPEAALKATVAELGCSLGKVRPLRSSAEYLARRDAQSRIANGARLRAVVKRHAADGWFAGKDIEEQIAAADRVAAHIISLMQDAMRGKSRLGKRPILPPLHLRWDAYLMVEGFAKRHAPLSPVACLMLDHAMGLYDQHGQPVDSAFCGIRKPDAFLAAARYEGTEEGADIASLYHLHSDLKQRGDPAADPKQLCRWRERESYRNIIEDSRPRSRDSERPQ